MFYVIQSILWEEPQLNLNKINFKIPHFTEEQVVLIAQIAAQATKSTTVEFTTQITELKQEIQQLKEDHKNEIHILHNEIKELKTENQKIDLRLADLEQHEKVMREINAVQLFNENKQLRAGLEKVIRDTTPDRKKTEKTYQRLAENFQGAGIDF